MNFPHSYRLRRPEYSYSDDGTKTFPDKHRGLLQFGPLRPSRIQEPHVLFIFEESERESANNLFLALRNGIDQFQGSKILTGISIERDSVEALRIPNDSYDGRILYELVEQRMHAEKRPDFAFILHGKQPSPLRDDPYHAIKSALVKYGVPSQFVSIELLKSYSQFKYAISNIALSTLVKLGGVPWGVTVKRNRPTLVFGIGKAEAQTRIGGKRRQLIGYATCVLSNGIYLNTDFFPPAESYSEFLNNLRAGLHNTLQQTIGQQASLQHSGIDKISVHISQLEKFETVRTIQDVVKQYADDSSNISPIELVKVTNDSDFFVFDLSDPGYVSEEGSVVALNHNQSLLVTEGKKEKSVWRGRKPVTLEIHRTYASSPSLTLKDTVVDAFSLSSVNWRGFNAVTQPISLQYAKLLAEQISKLLTVDPEICTYLEEHKNLSSVPWFI